MFSLLLKDLISDCFVRNTVVVGSNNSNTAVAAGSNSNITVVAANFRLISIIYNFHPFPYSAALV